jgi:hypothetical protein
MDRPLEEEVQWRDFELYEQVRIRQNRKRFFIFGSALILFLSLCAVPVVKERLPKWRSLRAAREISTELERVKTLSIQEKRPVRLKFIGGGQYRVDVLERCGSGGVLRELAPGTWTPRPEELVILSGAEAAKHSLGLATDEICFDPVFGLEVSPAARGVVVVVVVVPVNDLTAGRLDRASYVILDGESAKISIN